MPDKTILELVEPYVAASLGCPIAVIRKGGTYVATQRPSTHMMAKCGFVCQIEKTDSCILRVPSHLYAIVEERGRKALGRDSLVTATFWEDVFGQPVKRIGPNWNGFACGQDFKVLASVPARPLTSCDLAGLQAIAEACPEAEVVPSDLRDPAFRGCGCEVEGKLVAIAAVANSSGRIANLQVAVLPAFRRRGLASAAVSTLAAGLFADDYVLGYSTYADNAPSCALAQSLGFWHHDTTWHFIPKELWDGRKGSGHVR